jgi:hypothetical protein
VIVKVAPNRRDGQSSFEDLGGYITEGIGQSGDSAYRSSWDKLTQYITKDSVLDALGNDVEKTIAVEIGNVTSLATAASEMCAVANNNPRAENPVYHYILSWPEHERPDVQDIFGAARHTLKALGLHEHQYIIAIHGNTDHIHAHIEVNRVHPETYKATHIEWAHKTLHKAAREAELQYGWSHDNGLYSVVEVGGHKHVVENRLYKDGDRAPAKGRSADFEVWSGEQSLETWCRGAPAAALKELLTDPAVSSWQDIHRTLAKFGLVLQDSGGGGMKVGLSDNSQDTGRPLTVSASKAFRFMKRKALVDRFGAFVKPESSASVEVIPVITPTEKTGKTPVTTTYKRDPEKRLDRRLARQALRDDLRSRFREEQSKARDLHAHAKQVFKETFTELSDSRLAAFDSEIALKRVAIQKAQMLAPQKRNAYALLNLAARQEKSRLHEELRVEREAHRKLLPPLLVWRDWVTDLATQGDEAAISALRGLVYQDRRDLKKAELDATGDPQQAPVPPSSMSDRKEENAIWAASRQAHSDPVVLALQNLVWRVTTTGRVAYSFKSGESAFTDAGNRLTFDRAAVTDDALIASLAYARERFGESVRISGGDRVFQERAAKLAVRIGMKVSNPDLQHLMHATPETKQHPFNTSARSFRGRPPHPRLSLHADDLVPPPHHLNHQNQVAVARPLHPFIDIARNPNGRTIFEPYSLRVGGQEPPPAARAGLRTLSSIDLVRHENPGQGKADRSQELLPSVVPGVLEVGGADNNRGLRRAVPSNEGLIASRLKDMDPAGVLRAPDTSRGTYAGLIVLVTDESVVQAVGRHEYVSHSRVGMSGAPPVVGGAVKINYKNGVCSMSATKRDRGGRK